MVLGQNTFRHLTAFVIAMALMAMAGPYVWGAVAPAQTYICALEKVLDGDSVKVRCSDWPAPFRIVTLRIVGIDSPESHLPPAKCTKEVKLGLIAKFWLKDQFATARTVKFRWAGMPDKYGNRILAYVMLPNGKDVALEQIRLGHARAYDGATKGSWCN